MPAELISASFFLDKQLMQSLDVAGVRQLKGHCILFLSECHESDSLQVSALLEGSSVEFLFGVKMLSFGFNSGKDMLHLLHTLSHN